MGVTHHQTHKQIWPLMRRMPSPHSQNEPDWGQDLLSLLKYSVPGDTARHGTKGVVYTCWHKTHAAVQLPSVVLYPLIRSWLSQRSGHENKRPAGSQIPSLLRPTGGSLAISTTHWQASVGTKDWVYIGPWAQFSSQVLTPCTQLVELYDHSGSRLVQLNPLYYGSTADGVEVQQRQHWLLPCHELLLVRQREIVCVLIRDKQHVLCCRLAAGTTTSGTRVQHKEGGRGLSWWPPVWWIGAMSPAHVGPGIPLRRATGGFSPRPCAGDVPAL